MHIDLCATAIIEDSHLGNLRLKASEIAKIKRRSLRIIANDALGVDSSFGDSDITKGKAKGIKNPQRLSIGSSVRAVRTRNGGAAGLAPRFEDSDDSDYDPDQQTSPISLRLAAERLAAKQAGCNGTQRPATPTARGVKSPGSVSPEPAGKKRAR